MLWTSAKSPIDVREQSGRKVGSHGQWDAGARQCQATVAAGYLVRARTGTSRHRRRHRRKWRDWRRARPAVAFAERSQTFPSSSPWANPCSWGARPSNSIGRILPGRETIVVTRDRAFHPSRGRGPTAPSMSRMSIEAALALAAGAGASEMGADEIILAGGGNLYESLIGRAERMHLTFVDVAPRAQSVFRRSTGPIGWR